MFGRTGSSRQLRSESSQNAPAMTSIKRRARFFAAARS